MPIVPEPQHEQKTHASFAMSVDVEDYFQVWAFSSAVSRSSWDGFSLRVGDAARRCLDLFDEHDVKGTFFTLGWVAERDRPLIRQIVDRGHELASHGYDHTKVNEQDRAAFFQDVQRTKKLLEDISGANVAGYRAAGFSIDETTPWAYDTLAEVGHTYSSSVHPIKHDHYGDQHAPQTPYRPLSSSPFIEAPVATVNFLGQRISCAGGGWFRAFPYAAYRQLLNRAANRLNGPVIFYFHPWEIDPDQPRIKSVSARSRFRHYLNLKSMTPKLKRLLKAHPWRRIDETLDLFRREHTA